MGFASLYPSYELSGWVKVRSPDGAKCHPGRFRPRLMDRITLALHPGYTIQERSPRIAMPHVPLSYPKKQQCSSSWTT
jgi:hypothetical protein